MYRYINQIFLGSVCHSDTGTVSVDSYDPTREYDQYLSGGRIQTTTGYCETYTSGILSGDNSGSAFDYISTGDTVVSFGGTSFISEISGFSTRFSTGHVDTSGWLSGRISFIGFTGAVETYASGSADITGSGTIYGYGSGQASEGLFNISYTGDEDSAASGSFTGSVSGIGIYRLLGSGYYTVSGIFNETGSGYASIDTEGVATGHVGDSEHQSHSLFSGVSLLYRSGVWDEKVTGYQTGYCLSDRTNFRTQGCGSFAPFRSTCGRRGSLFTKIFSPVSNTVYQVPVGSGKLTPSELQMLNAKLVPITEESYGIEIGFTGTVLHGDDGNDPSDGDLDADGDDDERSYCPYASVANPSCSGSDGEITFNLINTDYDYCQLKPPYSGWVGYKPSFYETGETLIFSGVHTSTTPFPENLTISELSEGLYTLHLSGSSGTMNISAYLSPRGQAWVSEELLQNANSCSGTDGVIRFRWDQPISYSIGGTAHSGYSTTGCVISGLAAGTYELLTEQSVWCSTTHSFTIGDEQRPQLIVVSTGVSCTGTADGSARLSFYGGREPQTVEWIYPSGVAGETALELTGLATGLYQVDLYDASGCTYNYNFSLETDSKSLSVYTRAPNNPSGTICCQSSEESQYIEPEAVYAFANGGTRPYTYVWYLDNQPFHTGQYVYNAYPGSYVARVTDAKGCSTDSHARVISATNRCIKYRWTSVDSNGNQYKEVIGVAKPEELPLSVPFKYSVPGVYTVKLAASDGYGRTGLDCVDIIIRGFNQTDPPDDDPENDDPDDNGNYEGDHKPVVNPDPEQPDTQENAAKDEKVIILYAVDSDGDGELEDPEPPPQPPPPPGLPDPDGDDPDLDGGTSAPEEAGGDHETKVCCGLLSAGLNDNVCRTHCFTDASFCEDRPANRYQTAAKCEDCATIWEPQAGSCCVCKFVEGASPDLNYEDCECHSVVSCDPESAVAKLVLAAGGEAAGYYTHGFVLGGTCDETSDKYVCPAGICCKGEVPNGFVGEVGDNDVLCGTTCFGRMSEEACRKDKGKIISYSAMTCADAGAVLWGGQYYCDFKSAVCCIRPNPVDSTIDCDCFCDNNSTCKDCAQELASLQLAYPQCNYSGGALPYANAIGIQTCADLSCQCGSSSDGVGGPL